MLFILFPLIIDRVAGAGELKRLGILIGWDVVPS